MSYLADGKVMALWIQSARGSIILSTQRGRKRRKKGVTEEETWRRRTDALLVETKAQQIAALSKLMPSVGVILNLCQ